jgi:hypothetical protein
LHVIVNWGGRVKYDLDRIYSLAQMLKKSGCEISFIEKDPNRSCWLTERLGPNVVQR